MKKTKKIIFMFALISLFVITACNKEDEKLTEQKIRVVMLADGFTFDDLSFLQSCKAGMEQAKIDFGFEVEYNLDTATDNYLQRLDAYGEMYFDLIIAIGFMWNDAVIDAAKKYPQSKFVLVDTELSEPQANAVSILFDVDEASYPLGFLSAWWTDNHTAVNPAIAYVGALEIPQIRQFIEPWINGANRYNQKYGKTVAHFGDYAGDFFNPDLGKYIADSLISLGADVIFGVGSETGNGSLLKAKELGKWGIGVDVDQYISFPEVSDILLSCAMKGLDNAIYAVAKSFVDKTFSGGGVYIGKLANEGVGLAPYHDYENHIPDSIKLEIENIKAGIIDGSISTGW